MNQASKDNVSNFLTVKQQKNEENQEFNQKDFQC